MLDEIHNYGRKGRLFEIHFRNIRGSFATAGAFEEVLLDDGDMNMFKILLELKRIGYDSALNADHYPALEGDVKGGVQPVIGVHGRLHEGDAGCAGVCLAPLAGSASC